MDSKHSSICHLTFYECDSITINYVIGQPTAVISSSGKGVDLPVVGAVLNEFRSSLGNFIQVEFSAKITDTSKASESKLLTACYRYGVLILEYTDGSKKLLGTDSNPITMNYEKAGTPASFQLSINSLQAEYSKFVL